MEADFDRFYRRDLAATIWVDHWPASRIWARVSGLPEESAFGRSFHSGHTTLHELLAQVRDAVVTSAHGYRLSGRPTPYRRPGTAERATRTVDLTNPEDRAEIGRFFGTP